MACCKQRACGAYRLNSELTAAGCRVQGNIQPELLAVICAPLLFGHYCLSDLPGHCRLDSRMMTWTGPTGPDAILRVNQPGRSADAECSAATEPISALSQVLKEGQGCGWPAPPAQQVRRREGKHREEGVTKAGMSAYRYILVGSRRLLSCWLGPCQPAANPCLILTLNRHCVLLGHRLALHHAAGGPLGGAMWCPAARRRGGGGGGTSNRISCCSQCSV